MESLAQDKEYGFTLLALLVIISIMGICLSSAGKYWSTVAQRENEKELLFRGTQFLEAIGNYYQNSPRSTKTYPAKLEDLLKDPRYLTKTRHLRRIYKDPLNPDRDWGLILDNRGRIKGIYSKSNKEPLKKEGFPDGLSHFAGKNKYSDWKFVYLPPEKKK